MDYSLFEMVSIYDDDCTDRVNEHTVIMDEIEYTCHITDKLYSNLIFSLLRITRFVWWLVWFDLRKWRWGKNHKICLSFSFLSVSIKKRERNIDSIKCKSRLYTLRIISALYPRKFYRSYLVFNCEALRWSRDKTHCLSFICKIK